MQVPKIEFAHQHCNTTLRTLIHSSYKTISRSKIGVMSDAMILTRALSKALSPLAPLQQHVRLMAGHRS